MSNLKTLGKQTTLLFLISLLLTSQLPPVIAQQKSSSLAPAASEPNGKFELTIDNIMRGPGLVGYEPRAVRWSPDSQRIYFQWKRANESRDKDFDTYVVGRDGTGLKKLTEEEAKNTPPTGGELSKDKKLTLFTEDGDLFIYDNQAGQRRQITRTTDIETNAHFTRDQRRIYFTRSSNLFVLSLDTGSLVQMTDIRAAGAAPLTAGTGSGGQFGGGQFGGNQQARAGASAQRGTDSQEFIKKEERDLLDVVKRRAEKREEDEQKRKRDNPRKPFQLAARQSVVSLQLTPDESAVIATVIEAGEGSKNTIVPNYVTETAYSEDIPSRTKVGDSQSRSRLAALSVTSGDVKWVDHGQKQVAPRTEARTERATGESAERRDATQTQQQSATADPAASRGSDRSSARRSRAARARRSALSTALERRRHEGRRPCPLCGQQRPLDTRARPGHGQDAAHSNSARRRVDRWAGRVHARMDA